MSFKCDEFRVTMYLDFAGSETVAREDIMEAIERAKFGIMINNLGLVK